MLYPLGVTFRTLTQPLMQKGNTVGGIFFVLSTQIGKHLRKSRQKKTTFAGYLIVELMHFILKANILYTESNLHTYCK